MFVPLLQRSQAPWTVTFLQAAHDVAIYMASKGWSPRHCPSAVEQQIDVRTKLVFANPRVRPLVFPNPIGLAAGFDKNGSIIAPMLALGFGGVEIGTVTARPQPGNPKPRLFRLPQDEGLINRYGFNSEGAAVVEQNLQNYYQQQQKQKQKEEKEKSFPWWKSWLLWLIPSTPIPTGVVGINIGKNKDTDPEDTSAVISDYVECIGRLGKYADYLVINISSPNTPNLRNYQTPQNLAALLSACIRARNEIATKDGLVPALFVKLAPDLEDDELESIAHCCMSLGKEDGGGGGVDGIVVSNTTSQRPHELLSEHTLKEQAGGLSGRPIRESSTRIIRKLYELTQGKLIIIGVGGIGNGHDAYEKLKAGASFVQIYSMMVYHGPGLVSTIRHELAQLMVTNGQRTIKDVIGSDHEDIFWKKRVLQDKIVVGEEGPKEESTNEPNENDQAAPGLAVTHE
jgi:dihydroorotate dehydrogenase